MAKFCTRCGRPLSEGEICNCRNNYNASANNFNDPANNFNGSANNFNGSANDSDYRPGLMEDFKNFVGIGNPEINKGDTYERGKRIVPDCIRANDGEIPVKQYELATLQSRIFGIPYAKARGRLQVTNKRVVFRAPGRSVLGRTTLQHEFAIDELAGIEVRRDYYFSFWDFVGSLFIDHLGLLCAIAIFALIFQIESDVLAFIVSLIVTVACCVPMFKLKKHSLLKIFCLGCARGGCVSMAEAGKESGFLISVAVLLFIVIVFVLLVMTIVWAVRPNLVFIVKNKSSHDTIDIKRRSVITDWLGFVRGVREDHTGFNEVLPGDDADICIKEINAMMTDIQKLGDFGIDKWKA